MRLCADILSRSPKAEAHMRVPTAKLGKADFFPVDFEFMIIYGSHDIFHFGKNRAETGFRQVLLLK